MMQIYFFQKHPEVTKYLGNEYILENYLLQKYFVNNAIHVLSFVN